MVQTKVCASCNQEKSTLDFYKHKSTKDGLHNNCKECHYKKYKKTKKESAQQHIEEKRKEWTFYELPERGIVNKILLWKSTVSVLEAFILPLFPDGEDREVVLDICAKLEKLIAAEEAEMSKQDLARQGEEEVRVSRRNARRSALGLTEKKDMEGSSD